MCSFTDKINNIICNLEEYHDRFYENKTFLGPSLYFHKKALSLRESKDFERFIESVYAVLTSWGMHRMGKGGPKMKSFKEFYKSIILIKDEILELSEYKLENINNSIINKIKYIFLNISIMETNTILVANSKVLAHLLPYLIPPIDREYTLYFLKDVNDIKISKVNKDKIQQWELFESIYKLFFSPISKDVNFLESSNRWLAQKDKYYWDTSVPKIIDNLIIATKKS